MTDEGLRRVAVVVEDDADIRNLLEAVLTQAGFETYTAADGPDGVEQVRAHDPVVTTLDISLPGIDGFEVARRIRAFSTTYIVMLTARSDEIDTLVGLEAGADDYLTKPFRPRELRARIEAMLRRPRLARDVSPSDAAPAAAANAGTGTGAGIGTGTGTGHAFAPSAPAHAPAAGAGAGSAAPPSAEDLESDWVGNDTLRLSPSMRLVELDGVRIELTRTEFDLLLCIISYGNRVVSKSTLAIAMRGEVYDTGGYVSEADHRSVEVHLANLRRKIGDSGTRPRRIETVRGVGYRFAG